MASSVLRYALVASTLVSAAFAYRPQDAPNMYNKWMKAPNPDSEAAIPGSMNATFSQLIDHDNPELGTFEQFYYYGTEFWKGPGSPIILMTPGEGNATGYDSYILASRTTGLIAKEIGAAVVIVEHRYWGTSTPCTTLDTKCLQHLTLNNSIADFVNFAKTVQLPFDTTGASNADKAPWIMVGGSYPGALSAWTASTAADTFYAYWASSAPVQAMDYWEYFVPIQEGMAKNCSADVSLVVDHVDAIGFNGTKEQQKALQTMFGLGDVEHYDDFASTLQNGLWLWQGNSMYSNSGFFDFCDAVEGVNQKVTALATGKNATIAAIPGVEGVGLQNALEGYAAWTKYSFLPDYCSGFGYPEWQGKNNLGCISTYNASSPLYTDTSLSNQIDRQWVWMTCNEPFGYWQDSPPAGRPSVVSRFITQQYSERQCGLFFPPVDGAEYGIASGRTFDELNKFTGGWNIDDDTHLLYVNGEFDPWREAGVSSEFRPGGPMESTEETPILIVPGGFHCTDLVVKNGELNPGVMKVINAGVKQMVDWTAEYYSKKNGTDAEI